MAYRYSFGGVTWQYEDLKTLLAKASPARSGDELAGIAAASEQERMIAKMTLAEVPLKNFLNEALVPYEVDEVTRLIFDSHDHAAFDEIAGLTVGEFRDWLLGPDATTEVLARVAPGITPEMAAAKLSRPIHLAISCDEEIGCRGVPSLLAKIGKREVKPLGCFVGEPTNMEVVAGHKGKRAYRTTFHGSFGHSSLAPRHVNAVEWAARLVNEIQRVGGELAGSGPQDPRFDIAHSTLLTTTI